MRSLYLIKRQTVTRVELTERDIQRIVCILCEQKLAQNGYRLKGIISP